MRALQKAGDTRGMAARPAPAAPDGIERNIDRLRAEIREAEAGVARLRNRLEVLASDARIARPATAPHGPATPDRVNPGGAALPLTGASGNAPAPAQRSASDLATSAPATGEDKLFAE